MYSMLASKYSKIIYKFTKHKIKFARPTFSRRNETLNSTPHRRTNDTVNNTKNLL